MDKNNELKGTLDALNVRFEALLALLIEADLITLEDYKRSLAQIIKEYRQLRGLE